MELREQGAVVDFGSLHLGALKRIVTGGVAIPGDPGYEDAIRRWSALAVKQAVSQVHDHTTCRLPHQTLRSPKN